MKIKIESKQDGDIATGRGTKVTDENGQEIKNIRAITVQIVPDDVVIAYMDVYVNAKSIEAQGILSVESLIEAAAFYGLKLIREETH